MGKEGARFHSLKNFIPVVVCRLLTRPPDACQKRPSIEGKRTNIEAKET